ncbi:hypothetical protein [Microbulbifer magnicolonia]|uniref:hypothetical protein n=1 Tax=Microbulbifer magnicolonia TaxID=3109744 RepID=UPI002B40A2D8|nr:hypothetical protein [Microbulbifer sp. GG15]
MKKILPWLAIACIFTGPVFAQSGPVTITIPSGFEGPIAASHQSGAQVNAYVKKIPGQERGTLLQITTYDFGSKLDGLPAEKLGEAANYYLAQFLAAVQRQRESFESTEFTQVLLDGTPAARAEWHGTSSGLKMSGTMYCAVVGSQVISLHTQGFADSPAADTKAALAAINSVKFDRD